MIKLFAKRVVLVAIAFMVAFNVLSLGLAERVSAFGSPWPIIDIFNDAYLKPDWRAKWWIINWGEDNGTQGRFENFTGPYSSFSIQHEWFLNKFARLTVKPQAVPGFYTNVDVAEEHTGFQNEIVNEWKPTVNKSVELVTKVRWSDQFNVTGTGGAVGSSGVWLWNSPYDVVNYDPLALNRSFGFNYNEAGSYGGFLQGLTFNVIYNNNPIYVAPVPANLDMQDWNTFKMKWSVNASGVESIKFYVNGSQVANTVLPAPLGELSTEIWNDNQHVIFDQNGLSIVYENPESNQHFDIDYFTLRMVNN